MTAATHYLAAANGNHKAAALLAMSEADDEAVKTLVREMSPTGQALLMTAAEDLAELIHEMRS